MLLIQIVYHCLSLFLLMYGVLLPAASRPLILFTCAGIPRALLLLLIETL